MDDHAVDTACPCFVGGVASFAADKEESSIFQNPVYFVESFLQISPKIDGHKSSNQIERSFLIG